MSRRRIFEHFNLRIYLYVPAISIGLYNLMSITTENTLLLNDTFFENSIEISLTILGILLTILGLFAALPPSKYDEGMEKYSYFKIIFNTLFIGVMATILHLITNILNSFDTFQVYFFIIYISETIVATVWIYKILRLIYSSNILRE